MKWLKIPADRNKPLWGGLFWYLPCLYVFQAPYQNHAGWVEWTLTSIGFVLFFGLYAVGLIYWSDKKILRLVCAATATLAAIYTAYLPTFGLYFALVAAFIPFTVDGRIGWSAALIAALVLLHVAEAWLVRGVGHYLTFAVVISVEAIVVGAGTTFVARQQLAVARAHRAAERERIARDLHDILGHTLSVIVLKAELAGKLMEQSADRARAEVGEIEAISRKALAEVREAISGYHLGDIQGELERAHATLHAAGIKVQRECEKLELPAAHERVLTLVLREAVTNIVRHAHATNCRLQLQRVAQGIRLLISDDGRGGASESGNGIRGMRHRVEEVGGSVSWKCDVGTELTILLPEVATS